MSTQNEEITPTSAADETWVQAVERFEAEADYLTDADRPQVKALYSIAHALDGGTFQAALISQFTLIHRALSSRGTNTKGPAGGGGAEPDLLDMLDSNPGARWHPGTVWRGDAAV